MRIPRIYIDQPLNSGANIMLDGSAARHIASALRMTPGQEIVLFNGLGGEYTAELSTVGKSQVTALVGDGREVDRESALKLHLAIGVSRGERMDWIVQKATELGVSAITPLFTKRTEVKLSGERLDKKIRHWQQVAISACEQSGRVIPPLVALPVSLQDWVGEAQGKRYLLDQTMATTPEKAANPGQLTLLIGPEPNQDVGTEW